MSEQTLEASNLGGGSEVLSKKFMGVSPLMIFPDVIGRFRVYLKQDNWYVLYAGDGEQFTESHRQQLYDRGVDQVFIEYEQRGVYEEYLEEHLGQILSKSSIPVEERAKVFYSVSSEVMQSAFASNMPEHMGEDFRDRVTSFVRQSSEFFKAEESLKAVSSLITHDYKTYTHCVHVFLYAMAVLHQYELPENELVQYGVGAVLHDIGKTRIPREIINKPGKLTPAERIVINTHPVQGVAVCARMQLRQEAVNAILFHHERMDGRGYPANMTGRDIPLPVRIISVADAYDALTSNRAYAKAMRAFDALSIIKDTKVGTYDKEVYKRFIYMLGGANLV